MKLRTLAGLATALALVSASAIASSEFTLEIRGSGQYYEWGQPPLLDGDPLYPAAWRGLIHITTASPADGTYTGASLESIDFDSLYVGLNGYVAGNPGFKYKAGDTQGQDVDEGTFYTYGMETGASVTLSGGRVTGVDIHWDWDLGAGIDVVGFEASAEGYPNAGHHAGYINLYGIATPVSELPVPALMLAGLAAILAGMRLRAGRHPSH